MSMAFVMMRTSQVLTGTSLPNVHPRLDFPGSQYLVLLLDVFLGVLLLVFIGLFFMGLAKMITSLRNRGNEGVGAGVVMMLASVVAIIIVAGGAAFLNGWIKFFGS